MGDKKSAKAWQGSGALGLRCPTQTRRMCCARGGAMSACQPAPGRSTEGSQTLQTSDFQVDFQTDEYSQSDIPVVRGLARTLAGVCEHDLATECSWFGIATGRGLGPANRVVVTLTPSVRGGVNSGYLSNGPWIHVNPQVGAATDVFFLNTFAHELIEILMSYTSQFHTTGWWVENNSAGEGLARVTGELLHTPPGVYVNAWLASDPTADSPAPWPTRSFVRAGSRQTSPEAR